MTSFNLKFDEKMDTTLAEEYLKQHEEFHGVGSKDTGKVMLDAYNNKIFESDSRLETETYKTEFNLSDRAKKCLLLVEKLKENTELICQLEFLIRKIPMIHVRNFDLELLKQKFLYHGMHDDVYEYGYDFTSVNDTMPLLKLGQIAVARAPIISCTADVAVICKLFVDLCLQVGFEVKLIFTPFKSESLGWRSVLKNGLVGVLSEKSDVDSAVDAFLSAPVQLPWRISRIFVQESVLGRFQKAMEWKCQVRRDASDEIERACSAVYRQGEKRYLCEFAGDRIRAGQDVVVEAYRTVKELISLLNRVKPFGVSMWSADIALVNQIARSVTANFVWINGLGHIATPASAQTLYSIIQLCEYTPCRDMIRQTFCKNRDSELESLVNTRKRWSALDRSARVAKIRAFLEKLNSLEKCEFNLLNSFVSFDQNLCITIREPVDFHYKHLTSEEYILDNLRYVVDGAAICFLVGSEEEQTKYSTYQKALKEIDAPVLILVTNEQMNIKLISLHYTMKTIWTSAGTTFAN